MFEFRTLGTIDLRGEDGTSVSEPLRHSKRIALLAYLALPHPVRSHRRETLIALLWPELDESHGRGMLRHELYELRRALGPDAIRSDGRESVSVDGERIWCDARAFSSLLESGHLIAAVELLQGELLPGLSIPGVEFDRWLDGERIRLARRAGAAAGRLSMRAAEHGDLEAAASWARKWTELTPYNETGWRRLMSVLDRAGDRAAALAAFDSLAARLAEELEIEPAPETCEMAERIGAREGPLGPAGVPGRTTQAAHPSVPGQTLNEDSSEHDLPSPVVIAITPVENRTGEPGHAALCSRLTDRLVQCVSELAFLEVVVGSEVPWASAVISASLYSRGGGLEVQTRLAEAGDGGRILSMPESVIMDADPAPDALDEASDEIAARVLAAVAARYDPRVPIAFVGGVPVRTPAWEAWLEFIRGSEAFGAYRFPEAARRLYHAYELDPRFIKAGIFAAMAQAYCGDPEGADELVTRVTADGADTANDYERHFGDYLIADLRGHRQEAYRACRETARLTSHPVLTFLAGREAYRLNRPAAAVRVLEGNDTGQGWWRNWAEWYEVFGGACHLLGDHHSELDSVLRGRARMPEALEPLRAEVRARAALGESRAALDVVEEALTFPRVMIGPADVAWTAAHELETHGYPEAGADARCAGLGWISRQANPTRIDRLMEVRLLMESGDLAGAGGRLEALAPYEDLESIGLAGLLAATAGDGPSARAIAEQLEALRHPYVSGRHLLMASGIWAALGEPRRALDTLRRALADGYPFGVELHALPMLRPLNATTELRSILRPRERRLRERDRERGVLAAI
jgi:DNA-binding SARP family transcriptional activator